MITPCSRCLLALPLAWIAGAAPAQATVVTFEHGEEGWSGNALLEAEGGNPAANMHFLVESFGIELRTQSHAAFIGDLTGASPVRVGLDAQADSITFIGAEVSRNLVVEFRSHALAQGGYPWTSVWVVLGSIAAGPEWSSYEVVFDPASPELPEGWGGYGAEDPGTAEPVLPDGLTFADVMANVDEVAFTTFEPGWVYGFTQFDARMDNLRIERGEDPDLIFADSFEVAPALR